MSISLVGVSRPRSLPVIPGEAEGRKSVSQSLLVSYAIRSSVFWITKKRKTCDGFRGLSQWRARENFSLRCCCCCGWNWLLLSISTSVFVSVSAFSPFLRVAVVKPKARPPVALDVGRGHPTARIGAPMPTSSSPPTPSSLRSASTATSSTQSSPQQQQQVQHPHHSQSTSVASAATAALTNGTSPSASSSTGGGGGGAPPPSRQSEPKDLKYRETTPSAKKKVTGLFSHARTQGSAPFDSFTFVRYNSEHVLRPARQFYHIACSFVACLVSPLYLSNVANVNSIRRLQPSQSHTVGEEAETRTSSWWARANNISHNRQKEAE